MGMTRQERVDLHNLGKEMYVRDGVIPSQRRYMLRLGKLHDLV